MLDNFLIDMWVGTLRDASTSDQPRILLIKVARSMRVHSTYSMFSPSSPCRCGLWNTLSEIESALAENDLLDVKARGLIALATLLATLEMV